MLRLSFSKKINLLLLISSVCISCNLFSQESYFEKAQSQDESLFLRRIAEFWEDGEYGFAKTQIEKYLVDFPNTHLSEYLYAILGNISFEEKDYEKAQTYYDQINSSDTKEKICPNLLQGLYNLNKYEQLEIECRQFLDKKDLSPDLKVKITFLLAEALYNQALSNEEKKKEYASLAKEQYALLLDGEFEKEARLSLSQLDYILEDYEGAVANYFELAQKEPGKREEFLFQAAILQAEIDKEQAIKTFSEIIKLKKSKYSEAAFNKLMLLYELNKYEELLNEKNELLKLVSKDKIYLAHFFIGKIYFQQKNYKEAHLSLKETLNLDDKTSFHFKNALLMLMQCSYHQNDIESYNSYFEKFSHYFSEDPENIKALFARALLNKSNNFLEEAKIDFSNLETHLDKLENQAAFLFEYAHLLYQTDQINPARAKFFQFIESYPEHPLKAPCWHYLINSSLKAIIKSQNKEEEDFNKKGLIEDIDTALSHENLFSLKEQMEYRLLKAKTNFQLKNYEISLQEVEKLLAAINEETISISNDTVLDYKDFSELHLMAAFCYKNLNNSPLFCEHIEKALALNEDLQLDQSIYINLFNAKISLARESKNPEEIINLAANYLYKAFTISNLKISNENLNWLSDYYFLTVKNFVEENWQKNINEFNDLTLTSNKVLKILETLNANFQDDYLAKEPYIIKEAFLHKLQGDLEGHCTLLENLISQYRLKPEGAFTKRAEAIYEVTNTYIQSDKNDKALIIFEEFSKILNESNYFAFKSKLNFVRTKLNSLPKEKISLENPEIEEILSCLKTISMQKNLQNEPVHLEAALDYVDLLCYMENSDTKSEKRVLLLKRLKESFYSIDDVLSQEYQNMRSLLPQKDKIFSSYMTLIEAELMIAQQRFKLANTALLKLIEDDMIVTEYQNNRIKKNFKLIEEM